MEEEPQATKYSFLGKYKILNKKKFNVQICIFISVFVFVYFTIFYRYTLAQILGQRMRAVTDRLSYTIIWRSEGSVLCFLWHINVYIFVFCICIIYMDHWFWYSDANRCIIITILLSVCIMIIPCSAMIVNHHRRHHVCASSRFLAARGERSISLPASGAVLECEEAGGRTP